MAWKPVAKQKRQFPARLKKIRGDRSQRRFSQELGVFQQNVSRYEAGTAPSVSFLMTLAIKESVSLDWFLFGEGPMRRTTPRR